MAKHENPQRPPEIFYPAGHPKHKPPTPGVEQTAPASAQDLGDVIRGIRDLAYELHEAFLDMPDIADDNGRVDPEKFDASTRLAFVSCGNALDYAIRLVTEKGRAARIKKLRRELSDEMRAAGMSGDPLDGEPPPPTAPEQVR